MKIVISGHFEALLSTRPHDLRLASSKDPTIMLTFYISFFVCYKLLIKLLLKRDLNTVELGVLSLKTEHC